MPSEDASQTYAFNQKWLNKRGLKPDPLSIISVRGDSMEPDLNGDLVLIDLVNTDLADGKIYAVQYSGSLFVKRIQYVPGDLVRLVSRNTQPKKSKTRKRMASGSWVGWSRPCTSVKLRFTTIVFPFFQNLNKYQLEKITL